MVLKVLSSGSKGNCYILSSDSGKHLVLDCGIPIKEIKKGLGFDIGNTVAALCTHAHLDHSKAVKDLKKMGIPVWQPYLSEHKRQRTHFGEFECESFGVPHNGTPNVGYLIRVGGQVIAYITDMEYVGYSLTSQNIDTMIVECNYMEELVSGDLPQYTHKVLGHCSLNTTIGILQDNLKTLKHVVLVHMGLGTLDREKAMQRIREVVPEWITVEWAKAGETYNLSDCPF